MNGLEIEKPMPIYEYHCEKCKDIVEVLQKISDDPLDDCEKCGGKLSKQFNQMNFHLYGPGFYSTDNKRKYLK